MTARHPAPSAIDPACIAPGESLLLPVGRGTMLFAAEGQVRVVEAPCWVAERMLTVSQDLEAGQVHEMAADGWAQVTALGGGAARIVHVPPVRRASGFTARLHALWRSAVARLVRSGAASTPRALG